MFEKLSRDYQQLPLKRYKNNKLELPLKEDVELLFNYYNLTMKELGKYFNLSNGSIGNILLKYKIKKDNSKRISKIKSTKLERYGDENYNNREKFKETLSSFTEERWEEILNLRINTNEYRYGYKHQLQRPEIKKKIIETVRNNYGVDSVF